MSFEAYSKKAERWAANEGFDVLTVGETDRRIEFRHRFKKEVSFYIDCPENTEDCDAANNTAPAHSWVRK